MKRPIARLSPEIANTAIAYYRLSVDREGGTPQSIQAQKHDVRAYCKRNDLNLVEEYAESGVSGRDRNRVEFNRMIDRAQHGTPQIGVVVFSKLDRFARDLLTFLQTETTLQDVGIDIVSTSENFGRGRASRLSRHVAAVVGAKYADDASIHTAKSRRENARQGNWNGGRIPFGYESYVHEQHGSKERKRLRVCEPEARIVRLIFEWAALGLGGRAIVMKLNEMGLTQRGRTWYNGSINNVLTHTFYLGYYFDRTVDDEGYLPDEADWIRIECPAIIAAEQFEAAAAIRAARNPRRMAPHVAAGTNLLTGIGRCGMPGCHSGLTIYSGKGGQYSYITCNNRVNGPKTCTCPRMPRQKLDDIVLDVLERQLLVPERLEQLLAGLLENSEEANGRRRADLTEARKQETMARSAITRLLVLIETGDMSARDPAFAERLSIQKSSLATACSRVESLERQLSSGKRQITSHAIARFGEFMRKQLRGPDPALRNAYVRLLVQEVTLSETAITIRGSKAALESALVKEKKPLQGVVPIFDREWCPRPDSNRHSFQNRILSPARLPIPPLGHSVPTTSRTSADSSN